MTKRITIDFNKDLPFDIYPWTVKTWDGDNNKLGIQSNKITHSQSTSFTITGLIDYIKFDYIVSSETNYDKFSVYLDNIQVINIGTTSNTYEKKFVDQQIHSIKFVYSKDGSGSTGYDAVFLTNFTISSIDNEFMQFSKKYGVVDIDNKVYTLDSSGSVIKISDDISLMTDDDFIGLSENSKLINMASEFFSNERKVVCYVDNKNYEPSMKIKCMRNPGILKMLNSFYFNQNYTKGLEKFNVVVEKEEADICKFIVSKDDGSTWMTIKDDSFEEIVFLDSNTILENGITADMFNSLSKNLKNEIYSFGKLKIAIVMKPATLASNMKIKTFECLYITE